MGDRGTSPPDFRVDDANANCPSDFVSLIIHQKNLWQINDDDDEKHAISSEIFFSREGLAASPGSAPLVERVLPPPYMPPFAPTKPSGSTLRSSRIYADDRHRATAYSVLRRPMTSRFECIQANERSLAAEGAYVCM